MCFRPNIFADEKEFLDSFCLIIYELCNACHERRSPIARESLAERKRERDSEQLILIFTKTSFCFRNINKKFIKYLINKNAFKRQWLSLTMHLCFQKHVFVEQIFAQTFLKLNFDYTSRDNISAHTRPSLTWSLTEWKILRNQIKSIQIDARYLFKDQLGLIDINSWLIIEFWTQEVSENKS